MARCRTALPAAATVRITAARMASLSRTVDRDELERLLPSWHEVHAFRRGNSSPPAPAAEDESEFVDADDELAVAVGSAVADIINPERSDSATETKTRYLYGGKHVTEEDVRVAVRYWWHRLENVTDEPRICEDLLRLELKVHTIIDCNGTALNAQLLRYARTLRRSPPSDLQSSCGGDSRVEAPSWAGAQHGRAQLGGSEYAGRDGRARRHSRRGAQRVPASS